VLSGAAGSQVRPEVVAEPLDALRAEHGLAPDPDLAALDGDLVISPFPPSLRDPGFPLPANARSLRLAATASGTPDGPVYFTLGTVFNLECGDLFTRVLAGLRGRAAIVTVGPHVDPQELGPQPPEVRVERFVPQAELLPRCRAVVSHGGAGSVMGALAHGLPSVLIPMGADQMVNADRCAALGVARVLDAVRATPVDVREAVATVLEDPGYRHAAQQVRDEIARLPGPERAVELLEALD
jgi:MGT family glycosyltransferase